MSGKGSVPRPFSVDQETFSDNWDRIFSAKNSVQNEIDAVRRMRDNRSAGEQQEAAWLKNEHYDLDSCWCYECNKDVLVQNLPYHWTRMIVCPICGNKRCPHATYHALPCTNSNEPGQPGSRY